MPDERELPPLDFDTGGWSTTGAVRLRAGWFGFCVIEEQIESNGGCRRWRRAKGVLSLAKNSDRWNWLK